MKAHVRILLALLGCLVFGGNAIATDMGHCDVLCCDEPCESAPFVPESCACCAVRSTAETDPALPLVVPAAPLPALAAALPSLPEMTSFPCAAGVNPVPAPSPPSQRTTILRI
jgi:hypothetical protein